MSPRRKPARQPDDGEMERCIALSVALARQIAMMSGDEAEAARAALIIGRALKTAVAALASRPEIRAHWNRTGGSDGDQTTAPG